MTTIVGGLVLTIGGRTFRVPAEEVTPNAISFGFNPSSFSGEDDLLAGTKIFDVTINNGNGDGTFSVVTDPTGKFGALGGTGTARTISLSADLAGTAADTYTLTYRYEGDSADTSQTVDRSVEVTVSAAAAISTSMSPSSPSIADNIGASALVATLNVNNGTGNGTWAIVTDGTGELEIVSNSELRTKSTTTTITVNAAHALELSYTGDSSGAVSNIVTTVEVYDSTALIALDTFTLRNFGADKTGEVCVWGPAHSGPTSATGSYDPTVRKLTATSPDGTFFGGSIARFTPTRTGKVRTNFLAGVLGLSGTLTGGTDATLNASTAAGAEPAVTNPMTWAQWLAATTTEDLVVQGNLLPWVAYNAPNGYEIIPYSASDSSSQDFKVLGVDATADFTVGREVINTLQSGNDKFNTSISRYVVETVTFDGVDTTVTTEHYDKNKRQLKQGEGLNGTNRFYLRNDAGATAFSSSLRTDGVAIGKCAENDAAAAFRVVIPVTARESFIAHVRVWKRDANALSATNIAGTSIKLGAIAGNIGVEEWVESDVSGFQVLVNGTATEDTSPALPTWRWYHNGPNWMPFSYRRSSDGAVWEKFYWLIGKSGSDQIRYTPPKDANGSFRTYFMGKQFSLNLHHNTDLSHQFSRVVELVYPDGISTPVREVFRSDAIGGLWQHDTSSASDRPDIGFIPEWDLFVIHHGTENLDLSLVTAERCQGLNCYKTFQGANHRHAQIFSGTSPLASGTTAGGSTWPEERLARGREGLPSYRSQNPHSAWSYVEEDEQHSSSPFFFPYLWTGGFYHLESHLALVTSHVVREGTASSPGFLRTMYNQNVRAAGWTVDKVGQLMGAMPDDWDGSALGSSDMGRAAWVQWCGNQWSLSDLGTLNNGVPINWGRAFHYLSRDVSDTTGWNTPLGWYNAQPWMMNFVGFGTAHAAELQGMPTSFDEALKATYIHFCMRSGSTESPRWCVPEAYNGTLSYDLAIGHQAPDNIPGCWTLPDSGIEKAARTILQALQLKTAKIPGYKLYPTTEYTVTDLGNNDYRIDLSAATLNATRADWYTTANGLRGGFIFVVAPVWSGSISRSSSGGIGFITNVASASQFIIHADGTAAKYFYDGGNSITPKNPTAGTYSGDLWLPVHPLDYGDHNTFETGFTPNKNYLNGARGSIEVWESAIAALGLAAHPNWQAARDFLQARVVASGSTYPLVETVATKYSFSARSVNP